MCAMLRKLYIRNFALIREMDVTFPKGLTVITGETGAGKSIFLEALGLVLGKRADTSALQDKAQKCVIEAEFELSQELVGAIFEEHDLEFDAQAIIRREISSEGKSRSFLNDSPVSLSVLKQLAGYVIDIHSQHETLLLGDTQFRFDIVDAFAGTTELFMLYQKHWQQHALLVKQQQERIEQEQKARKEQDYIQFLFNELNEEPLQEGELKACEEEATTLENAGYIRSQLSLASQLLSNGEAPVLGALAQARQAIGLVAKFKPEYQTLAERLNSVVIELKDLSGELESEAEKVTLDPARLEWLNEKTDRLNRLMKKHGVTSEPDLIAEKERLEQQLLQFTSLAAQIEKGNKAIDKSYKECVDLAKALSEKRTLVLKQLEIDMDVLLHDLSMPNARFLAELSQKRELNSFGFDELRFLFSANKGSEFKELQKVASGGELSRVMLSLKSLLAGKKQLPTIIFDEIDTGVSGDVAAKIGNILEKMGTGLQVISITHLPQIASKGKHHLFVYKQDDEKQTNSYIKPLTKEERINEIAKMLSTGTPTTSALKNAKELLGS